MIFNPVNFGIEAPARSGLGTQERSVLQARKEKLDDFFPNVLYVFDSSDAVVPFMSA